jgi:hypothetical protein
MDKELKAAIESALMAERKRGMDDAINAAINAYNRENFADMGNMTTWEIRDILLNGIRAARDKLK